MRLSENLSETQSKDWVLVINTNMED